MSFKPNATTQQGTTGLGNVSSAALANSGEQKAAGTGLMGIGGQNIQSGTNYFNTLLNGNRANATSLLQPDINRIREANSNTLTAINTLMPRGGGRSSALFGQSLAPTSQIMSLFAPTRGQAASTLPQIGLNQQSQGAGLLGLSNSALNPAAAANASLGQIGQTQQKMGMDFWSGLGSGILGLATTPFGGGGAANGLLGLIGHKT